MTLAFRLPGPARRAIQTIEKTLDRRERIHFLHLGKCAGMQIRHIATAFNNKSTKYKIIKHGHRRFLWDIPEADLYFFTIRNPVTRFKSGFYSRKRKGQPRIYSPWSAHDTIAFAHFDHANDLAEALFTNGERGFHAFCAMKSLIHCSMNQVDWFSTRGAFLEVSPPIAIIRQEHFERDLAVLSRYVDDDLSGYVEKSSAKAHSNDYSGIPDLSPLAIENLEKWYAQDLVFYDVCSRWVEQKHQEAIVRESP